MNNTPIKSLFIIFNILVSSIALGQEKLQEGKVTLNKRIYLVSKTETGSYKVMDNPSYIRAMEQSGPTVSLGTTAFTGSETINSVVIKVIGKTRIKDLASEKGGVAVTLYPDHTGKIKAVAFRRPPGQTITLEELDRISTYIKKNLSYHVVNDVRPGQKISPVSYVFRFSYLNRLLQNSPNARKSTYGTINFIEPYKFFWLQQLKLHL